MPEKKKILFVGAGGTVASKLLPKLSELYDIVGIAGRRGHLRQYCSDFYSGDLLASSHELFDEIFSKHHFGAIVWNAFHFTSSPLVDTPPQRLHAEFELSIVKPLECLRAANNAFATNGAFVVVTSGLGLGGYIPNSGSYAMMKSAQVILANFLARELMPRSVKAIALGTIGNINETDLCEVFTQSIENVDPEKTLYTLYTSQQQ